MGYYTYFTLQVKGINSKEEYDQLAKCLQEKGIIGYALQDDGFNPDRKTQCFPPDDEAKWYNYSADINGVSKEFPLLIFCLHGEGEDREDTWDAYYLNGEEEYCHAIVTTPPPKHISWS